MLQDLVSSANMSVKACSYPLLIWLQFLLHSSAVQFNIHIIWFKFSAGHLCAIQYSGAVEVTESCVPSWSELDSTANMSIKPCSMFISSQCSAHCCSWSHWVTSGVSEWSCVHWTAHCLHFASSSSKSPLFSFPTMSINHWYTMIDINGLSAQNYEYFKGSIFQLSNVQIVTPQLYTVSKLRMTHLTKVTLVSKW